MLSEQGQNFIRKMELIVELMEVEKDEGCLSLFARDVAERLCEQVLHGRGLTSLEITLGTNEGKISAIKEYRTRTGTSLSETKTAVEDYFKQNMKFYGV